MRHGRFLRYVDAVAREGSVRKAAERLNVTPSALIRRIIDIEEELETPLFERLPRGMRPTAAGEVFLAFVRRHGAELDRVRSEIEGLKGLRRGHVRIAASQALAAWFLPQEIATFRTAYPGITFDVRVADRGESVRALAAYEADLAVTIMPPRDSNVLPLTIIEQGLVAMMPADHPLAGRDSLRLRECLHHPLVLPTPSLGGRELLEDALGPDLRSARILVETNSFELMRGVLARERAIGFQLDIGGPTPDTAPDLVGVPVDRRDVPPAPLVFAQLDGRTLPVPVAQFASALSTRLEGMRRRSAPAA